MRDASIDAKEASFLMHLKERGLAGLINPTPAWGLSEWGSKPVSVAMLLQVIGLLSHMACAQVPK